jgi:hypothetical protein
VAVPVISSSVFQISTSSCPATRMQRLSRVFQSCRVRGDGRRPSSAGRDGLAEEAASQGRGDDGEKLRQWRFGHDVALSTALGDGVGGPRSGCNSRQRGGLAARGSNQRGSPLGFFGPEGSGSSPSIVPPLCG